MRIPVATASLADFAARVLAALGVPERNARLVADGLVEADMKEIESHGMMLLPMYVDRLAAGSIAPAGEGVVVSDRGASVVINAHNALGQVTSEKAVALAAERAAAHGLAAVAVRNGFHFGTAGRWAERIARSGCVGIAMSNTRTLMPAPGGAERLVGNNPIAIAVPGRDAPIVVDFATSATAMGKIRLAAAQGGELPDGWASDNDGAPTTDPQAAIKGMLLSAAGPKGFGLAVMIDLICGGLSSGAIGEGVRPLYGDPADPYGCSHVFLAIDVEPFRPLGDFTAAVETFAARVRGSRPAAGQDRVSMPGDRSARAAARNAQTCMVASSTVAALRQLAARFTLDLPDDLQVDQKA